MTAAQLVNVLYSVVDRIYLGSLPSSDSLALTGLGVTMPIVSILMGFANLCGTLFVMICLGMNPFINAQGFGKTGMMTVLLGAAVNIALDPVLILMYAITHSKSAPTAAASGCGFVFLSSHSGNHTLV